MAFGRLTPNLLRLFVTGITIKPESGPPQTYTIDPITDCVGIPGETPDCNPIDLLYLREGRVRTVSSDLELSAGRYEWLRLEVDESLSYVVEDDGGIDPIEIRIPSERGLQLSGGFVILANQTTDLMMDWETRKGLTNPLGQDGYILKPSIRLIDLAQFGSITGSVIETTMVGCPDIAVAYVFEGDLVTGAPADDKAANLDDIDNHEPDPLVTAMVNSRDDGSYGYQVDYLPIGTYSVALVCQNDPVPDTDALDEANNDLNFIGPQVANVSDGSLEVINF